MFIDRRGYVMINVNGRHVRQHRHLMAQAIGRPLLPTEVVHHINGNKSDNRLENLELCSSQSEHLLHGHATMNRKRKNPPPKRFCHCGLPYKSHGLCATHYAALRRRRAGMQQQIVRLVCWCGKPHVARGLCDRHYSQAKRLGFPAYIGTIVLNRSTNAATRLPQNRSSSNRAGEPEP